MGGAEQQIAFFPKVSTCYKKEDFMDLSEFLGIIIKWKWLVLPIVVLVTGYTLVTGLWTPKNYSAQANVVVGLSQIANFNASGFSLVSAAQSIDSTYGELLSSKPVLSKALAKAGLNWDTETLRSRVSYTLPNNTTVIQISVVDENPERAVTLANAVADSLVEYIQETGQAQINNSRTIVTNELASIENDLNVLLSKGVRSDDGRVKALIDRRNSAQEVYSTLLEKMMNTGDIRVDSPAHYSRSVGISTTIRTLIGLVISIIFGIVLAFIAEGVVVSLRRDKQGKKAV
ncbi:MAG: YveK family protein [Thermoleophilia bacterium]